MVKEHLFVSGICYLWQVQSFWLYSRYSSKFNKVYNGDFGGGGDDDGGDDDDDNDGDDAAAVMINQE